MNAQELLRSLSNIDDALVIETGSRLNAHQAGNDLDLSSTVDFKEAIMHKNTKKLLRTGLAVAAVLCVLVATAWAAGVFGTGIHEVDGPVRGELNGQWVTYEDARMYLTFDSEHVRHAVLFQANWLPSAPNWGDDGLYGEGAGYDGGFVSCLSDQGEDSILPYVINASNKAPLQGIRHTLNGETTVVKQDLWNGFERTEIAVDYSRQKYPTYDAANYLFLFQPEDNYLIYLGGTDSMETMEKIAENLEIQVGDAMPDLHADGFDVCWFDIGRG